jgi:type II secretory pathway component PulF
MWDDIGKILWAIFLMAIPLFLFAAQIAVLFALGAPLRRRERTQLFLDILEAGQRVGRSPEQTIAELSASRDRALGPGLHRLAAHLQSGLRLSEALRRVPTLIYPRCADLLRVAEQTGNIGAVLPVCRALTTDAASRSTSAVNFFVLGLLLFNPAGPGVFPFMVIFILPKFQVIAMDLTNGHLPSLLRFLVDHQQAILLTQIIITLLLPLGLIFYLAEPPGKAITDRIAWLLPWKRKRLLRTFSSMLAVLLDAAVPEAEAVTMAAASTGNHILIQYGKDTVQRLQAGSALPAAIAKFPDTGEFCWRLANAAHTQCGFLNALAGWHDALDARAYQQEQTASQFLSTGLVVLNGVFVGFLAAGVFQILTNIIAEAALW